LLFKMNTNKVILLCKYKF